MYTVCNSTARFVEWGDGMIFSDDFKASVFPLGPHKREIIATETVFVNQNYFVGMQTGRHAHWK